jgi:hypothetical protein
MLKDQLQYCKDNNGATQAVQHVIDLLEEHGDNIPESVAKSAESAARSARSAESAAWSARSAAESAALARLRERYFEILESRL